MTPLNNRIARLRTKISNMHMAQAMADSSQARRQDQEAIDQRLQVSGKLENEAWRLENDDDYARQFEALQGHAETYADQVALITRVSLETGATTEAFEELTTAELERLVVLAQGINQESKAA